MTAISPAATTTRGRSALPGRSPMRAYSTSPSGRTPAFASQFSFTRDHTDPSPHLYYDKITRHASPARKLSDQDPQDIVPKIPQPYRTSFSAVTSPYRRTRQSTGGISPSAGLTRNSPGRSTMPVKVGHLSSHNTKSDDLLARSPLRECTFRQEPRVDRHGGSHGDILESVQDTSTRTIKDEPHSFVRNGMHYSSTPASMRGRVTPGSRDNSYRVDGDSPDNVFEDSRLASPDLSEHNVRSFMENTDPDKVLANGGRSPPYGSSELIEDTVQAKKLISKEYAHQESVSYFQLLEKQKKKKLVSPNAQTNRFMSFIMKGVAPQRSQSAERPVKVNQEGYDPDLVRATSRSVENILSDKTIQSNISLPAEVLSGTKKHLKEQQVKKSHSSSSIWNIFRRLSPRSFRRGTRSQSVGRNSSRENSQSTPNGSDTSLHLVPVDIEDKGSQDSLQKGLNSSRSFRKKLSKSKSKKGKQSGSLEDLLSANTISKASSETSTPPAVTANSARIMRSIEDNSLASHGKSVYQAFKEKQSPKQPREAVSLRPQALRPVEFPETLLSKTGSGSSSSPSVTPSVPEGPRGQPAGAEGPPKVRGSEPPKTLNVRNVSKRTFYSKSQSVDSIGDCSLDVQGTGTWV